MKFCVVLALIGLASALPANEAEREFNNFKVRFNRQYPNAEEELIRRTIFVNNFNRINAHNKAADNGLHSFRVGVNQFTDMTKEEVKQKMNGFRFDLKEPSQNVYVGEHIGDLPATVNWTAKGVVTPVKDQGQCGSCWAFCTTGSLEGQLALKTGKLVSLSEENLMDCSTAEGNMGCEGGLPDQAFQYVIANKGLDSEASYPYKGVDESCEYNPKNKAVDITGFTDVKSGSEDALKAAVANVGPISIGIDASSDAFMSYTSGVLDDTECTSTQLDHGVTLVGYGTENGQDYWLVKNSWGTTWGESGYIKMSRNKNNQCGIATAPSFPTGVTN